MVHIVARKSYAAIALLVILLSVTLASDPTNALPFLGPCPGQALLTSSELLDCVTVDGVREHQAALQAIADANNGHRVSGSSGYDASVDYVVGVLEAAGYSPVVQTFQFQTFFQVTPSILEQIAPPPTGPHPHTILSQSGSGDVTAPVSTTAGPLGCDAADFAGFTPGNIALIARGTCTFEVKATNASNAGAAAVIIYNNVADAPLSGTLGIGFDLNLPVVGVTQALGQDLATTAGLVMRVKTDTVRGMVESTNVIADSRYGDPTNVVMAGAHLDSVNAGPGIQDNGAAVGALLEVAEQIASLHTLNKVRFAFWGAFESGFVGSQFYVNNLTTSEQDDIALYLNFDIIASPNYVFFIYDGDDSDGVDNGPGPNGSGDVEALFKGFYSQRNLPFKGQDLSPFADHQPFIGAGIPVGGIFTGSFGIKTPEEQALWGGTAGQQYDPCYHLACDTFDNISLTALDVNSDAVAFAVYHYAMDLDTRCLGETTLLCTAYNSPIFQTFWRRLLSLFTFN